MRSMLCGPDTSLSTQEPGNTGRQAALGLAGEVTVPGLGGTRTLLEARPVLLGHMDSSLSL